MNCKINGIVTNISKSNKSNNQYLSVFDLESTSEYSMVSREDNLSEIPTKVPVLIECNISPRVFSKDGQRSTVLYVSDVRYKKGG